MRVLTGFLLISLTPVLTSIAEAQLNRAAVSVNGSDANSCMPVSPCRTFARAISQTNAGGEVIALDSGGYGPFTVDKNITVQAAPGVYAGITATTGFAVTVSAVGIEEPVVLRNLTLNSLGGTQGIHYTAGGYLHVENCTIHGFLNYGIAFVPTDATQISKMFVRGAQVRRCGDAGIFVHSILDSSWPAHASIEHSYLDANHAGVEAGENSLVTARHTVATAGDYGFLARAYPENTYARLILDHCAATNNGAGIRGESNSETWVADCTISGSGTGVDHTTPAEVLSRGNNTLAGNMSDGVFTNVFPPQ